MVVARTVSVLLIAVLLAAGCGDRGTGDPQAGGVRGADEEPEAAAGDGEARAPDDGPFRVGLLIPQSGPYAANGQAIEDGLRLYFEQRDYEVAGREIEVIVEDEELSPEAGVQAARKLVERDGVDVLVGMVQTPIAFAVREVAHGAGVPLLLANPSGNALTGPDYPTVFRIGYSAHQVSYPLGGWLVDEGYDRLFVLSTDHSGGREFAGSLLEGFEEAGGEAVAEVYAPLGTADYSSYLQQIATADADGVWAFFGGVDAVRFVQQYEEAGLKERLPLFGMGGLVDGATFGTEGEAAVGVLATFLYSSTLEHLENQEFVAAIEERFGNVANDYNVEGYDAAWAIGEALAALGGDVPDSETLVAGLADVEFASPRGPMHLDEHRSVVQNIYLRETTPRDGVFVHEVVDVFEMVGTPAD